MKKVVKCKYIIGKEGIITMKSTGIVRKVDELG